MKKKIFIVAAAFISSQVQAQTDSTKTLDEVIFTANKQVQKQSSTGKVLTVINRQVLEQNTGRSIAQVLNEQAGIVISGAQNPLGANQYVYVRGASAPNTLILVDGVPAYDASGISPAFDINHFAIDQIEKIEILKGAQSVLYGSDAVAAVINIITKKQDSNKAAGVNASLSGGSYGTFKGMAAVSGKADAITYNLQYSKLKSTGFSAAEDVSGNNNFDKDGFNQDVAGINVTTQAAKNWQLRLFGQYARYTADIDDGAFMDDKNHIISNKNLQAGIASITKFNKGSVTVNLNLNNTDREIDDKRNVPDDPNDYDPYNALYKGKSLFAEAYTNLSLHKNFAVLAGTDIRSNKASSKTSYGDLGSDSLKSTLISGYASLLLKSWHGLSAELGGRYSHHNEFGNAFTYSFNPSYLINRQVKIFANISSGFRAPSLYQLSSEYGNKNLKPEKSNSYEGGIQYTDHKNTLNLRATYFIRKIKEVIIFKSLPAAPWAQYANADKQDDNGLELEATLRPCSKLGITANYAFVTGNIKTQSALTAKDTSLYNLYRRPKHIINANISYQATKKLFTSIGFRWADKALDQYYDASAWETKTVEMPSFYYIDVHASYQVLKGVKLFADLRNITNQKYYELYGYNSRRFNFMAGALVNF
ncbi:MAG TPA: TonB-dependent receptor [Ferruginibacter sp.]|nr:TonB-dependent receptor [Ferruginibacter sp.]HMP22295.1 TonB-dependent receptor [Ferruginibacter sp.]